MNHDEFMRRALAQETISEARRGFLEELGQSYLTRIRAMDGMTRALSIASYEDGGLQAVFGAILQARNWDGPALQAFKHFLKEHIRFDSDPDAGHGALCRHLKVDDQILPLWTAFRHISCGSGARARRFRGLNLRAKWRPLASPGLRLAHRSRFGCAGGVPSGN